MSAPAEQAALDALTGIDEELENLDDDLRKATQRVTFQFEKRRQSVYEKRAELARNVKQFWPTALQNHPDLSNLLTPQDIQALAFLTDFECVPSGEDHLESLKIIFTFKPNPFFENDKLVKEYEVKNDNLVVKAHTNPIRWKEGHDLTAKKTSTVPAGSKRKAAEAMADSVSFFNYFTTSNPALDEELAQFLFEDFWRRAFDYYQGVEQNDDDIADFDGDGDDDDDDEDDEEEE